MAADILKGICFLRIRLGIHCSGGDRISMNVFRFQRFQQSSKYDVAVVE